MTWTLSEEKCLWLPPFSLTLVFSWLENLVRRQQRCVMSFIFHDFVWIEIFFSVSASIMARFLGFLRPSYALQKISIVLVKVKNTKTVDKICWKIWEFLGEKTFNWILNHVVAILTFHQAPLFSLASRGIDKDPISINFHESRITPGAAEATIRPLHDVPHRLSILKCPHSLLSTIRKYWLGLLIRHVLLRLVKGDHWSFLPSWQLTIGSGYIIDSKTCPHVCIYFSLSE